MAGERGVRKGRAVTVKMGRRPCAGSEILRGRREAKVKLRK